MVDGGPDREGGARVDRMRLLRPALAITIAGLLAFTQYGCSATGTPTAIPARGEATTSAATGDSVLARAFAERASSLEVQGQGTVSRLLSDDSDGARHQRFILRLDSGQTVLVAHNIDVAPRVDPLRVGDTVSFKGEYEWNAQGGVIHWTHHDPTGSHTAGWLAHDGRTYQ